MHSFPIGFTVPTLLIFAVLLIMSTSSLALHYWPLRSCSSHVWAASRGHQDLMGLIGPWGVGHKKGGQDSIAGVWWCFSRVILQEVLGLLQCVITVPACSPNKSSLYECVYTVCVYTSACHVISSCPTAEVLLIFSLTKDSFCHLGSSWTKQVTG